MPKMDTMDFGTSNLEPMPEVKLAPYTREWKIMSNSGKLIWF